jgi:MFS family permease
LKRAFNEAREEFMVCHATMPCANVLCFVLCAGMLLFGILGDSIGRRWGSRMVATIMLSGTILLTFAPLIPDPARYLNLYIFAATW